MPRRCLFSSHRRRIDAHFLPRAPRTRSQPCYLITRTHFNASFFCPVLKNRFDCRKRGFTPRHLEKSPDSSWRQDDDDGNISRCSTTATRSNLISIFNPQSFAGSYHTDSMPPPTPTLLRPQSRSSSSSTFKPAIARGPETLWFGHRRLQSSVDNMIAHGSPGKINCRGIVGCANAREGPRHQRSRTNESSRHPRARKRGRRRVLLLATRRMSLALVAATKVEVLEQRLKDLICYLMEQTVGGWGEAAVVQDINRVAVVARVAVKLLVRSMSVISRAVLGTVMMLGGFLVVVLQ